MCKVYWQLLYQPLPRDRYVVPRADKDRSPATHISHTTKGKASEAHVTSQEAHCRIVTFPTLEAMRQSNKATEHYETGQLYRSHSYPILHRTLVVNLILRMLIRSISLGLRGCS